MDVSEELLKKLQDEFQKKLTSHQTLSKIKKKIELGTATYHDAHEYSIKIGEILAEVFDQNLMGATLPNGKMYFNIAQKVVDPMMVNNFNLIADNTVQIQEVLNAKANIGLAGQYPDLIRDKVDGIIQRLADEELFDDIKWILKEPIVNFSQSVVDDTMKKNAEFHYKAGLNPKIIRTSKNGCCAWCKKIAGTYDYKDVMEKGNDIYRRHNRCRCETDYVPSDGKEQNVWDKTWR